MAASLTVSNAYTRDQPFRIRPSRSNQRSMKPSSKIARAHCNHDATPNADAACAGSASPVDNDSFISRTFRPSAEPIGINIELLIGQPRSIQQENQARSRCFLWKGQNIRSRSKGSKSTREGAQAVQWRPDRRSCHTWKDGLQEQCVCVVSLDADITRTVLTATQS